MKKTNLELLVGTLVPALVGCGIVVTTTFNSVPAFRPTTLSEPKFIAVGHGSKVGSVVFSPDGKNLITGSRDRTVRFWDPRTGEVRRTLRGHKGEENSIALSPTGNILAISTANNSVDLYDGSGERLIRSLAGAEIRGPSAFSYDSKLIVTRSVNEKGNLQLWNTETGKVVQTVVAHTDGVNAIAFSRKHNWIVSAGADKTVKLWDADTGKFIRNLTGFKFTQDDVVFSPDGDIVAAADDVTVRFWNASTGELKKEIHSEVPSRNFEPPVNSIQFSPDGALLAVASSDSRFTVLDVASGTPRHNFTQASRPLAAAFSPDGETVVTGCEPKAIYFWDLETGDLRIKIGNESESHAVAFAPDGKTVASDAGLFDHTVSLWNLETGTLTRTLKGHEGLEALVFSPNSKKLVGVESYPNNLLIWDVASGDLIETVKISDSDSSTTAAFSPDGKLVATIGYSDDGTIKLIDTQRWQVQRKIPASRTFTRTNQATGEKERVGLTIVCGRFSRDGASYAAVVDDGTATKFWSTRTWRLLRTVPLNVPDMFHCDFSPDLKMIVADYRGLDNPRLKKVDVWDSTTGSLLRSVARNDANLQAFSPDGKLFVTSDDTWNVELRDVTTTKVMLALKGHSGEISAAAFSPNGQLLVTGSLDGTVRVWDARSGAQRKVFVLGASNTAAP